MKLITMMSKFVKVRFWILRPRNVGISRGEEFSIQEPTFSYLSSSSVSSNPVD